MKKLFLVSLIVAFTASSGIQVPANAATIPKVNDGNTMVYAPENKAYVPTTALNLQIWSKVVDPTLNNAGCVYRGLIGAYDQQGQNELSYLDDVVKLMGQENILKLDSVDEKVKISNEVVYVKFGKSRVPKKLRTSTIQVELPLAIKDDVIYNIPEIQPFDGQTVYMTKTTPVGKSVDRERTFLWICSTTNDYPIVTDAPETNALGTVFKSPVADKEYLLYHRGDMACLTNFFDPDTGKDSITKAYVNFVNYLTGDSPFNTSFYIPQGPRNAFSHKYDNGKLIGKFKKHSLFQHSEPAWSARAAMYTYFLDEHGESKLSSDYVGSEEMAHGFSMWWLTRAGNYKKARFQDLAIVANTRINLNNTYEQFKKAVSADWSSFYQIRVALGWSASPLGVKARTDYKDYLGETYTGSNTNVDMSVYGVKYFIGQGEKINLRNALATNPNLSELIVGDLVRDNSDHVYVAGYKKNVPSWYLEGAGNLSLNQGGGKGPYIAVNTDPIRLSIRLPY